MNKSLIFIIGLSCLSTAFAETEKPDPMDAVKLAQEWAERKPGYPMFRGNYIVLWSNYFLCGGFTIAPKAGMSVRLMARKYEAPLIGKKRFSPGDILSRNPDKKAIYEDKNWVVLQGSLRAKYNWPGYRKEFRIFCQKRDPFGTWLDAPCKEVVTISKEEVKHKKLCPSVLGWFGKGVGPKTYYAPLNMQ